MKSLTQPKYKLGLVLALASIATYVAAHATEPTPPTSVSPTSVTDCGITAAQQQRIEQINQDLITRGFAAGVTTHIHCDGKSVIRVTEGMADAARQRLLAEDDLFRIYSMTKPLTSLAAMILVDDKKIALDDPIAKYLPEFANATVLESGETAEALKTKPLEKPPTVRDLLRHTAGLTYMGPGPSIVERMYAMRGIDHGGGTPVVPMDKSPAVTDINDYTKRLATIPLLYQPGARFSYGNATDVLAAVVEKASGQRYRDFMAARIFKPLNMKDTFFQVPPNRVSRLTAAYAAKSSEASNGNVLRSTNIAALGLGMIGQIEDPKMSLFARPRYIDFGGAGLISTAADYQRFLQMMLQDGQLDGARIVSAGTVAEMTKNQLSAEALATPNMAAQGLGFGLGFAKFLNPSKAPAAVPANGYFWGGAASTYFWVDPDRKISGVVMTQVFGGDVMPFYLEMLNTLYKDSASVKTAAITK
jgi:CubicO group peptidase (beta-lactamase class C family)